MFLKNIVDTTEQLPLEQMLLEQMFAPAKVGTAILFTFC
jgi:hypothetical protein